MSSEHDTERTGAATPGTDAASRHRRVVRALLLTMFVSWLLLLAPLPFSLAAGIGALVALGLLIVLAVQSFRQGRHGMAVLSLLIGVPATLMITAGSVLSLLFYGPMAEVEECRATALTEQARVQCDAEAQDSMATWISDLMGG